MTKHTLHKQLEQIETNLALAAEELGVGYKISDDPEQEAAKAEFFTGEPAPANKSEAEKQAERVERIAEDSIVIAEAAGVASYKVDGSATRPSESQAAKELFDPREGR